MDPTQEKRELHLRREDPEVVPSEEEETSEETSEVDVLGGDFPNVRDFLLVPGVSGTAGLGEEEVDLGEELLGAEGALTAERAFKIVFLVLRLRTS